MSTEVPALLRNIFKYIDENYEKFIANLKEAVEIPSVSAVPSRRLDCIFIMHWMAEKMADNSIKVEVCELGDQKLPNGTSLKFPPLVLGKLGSDPNKKTLLIYSHLDVVSAFKEDGWETDPFMLVEKDDKLYGRGVSDNKGPTLGWLHAIESYQNNNIELPVNIKFLFVGIEEQGLVEIEEFLKTKEQFFTDVDFICSTSCLWLGLNKPCIAYGFRGCCFFYIEIQCTKRDHHSGRHGGVFFDAMNDLLYLMNRLVDVEGNILIPGVYDDVEPVTTQEEKMYANIDYNVKAYKEQIGCQSLIYEEKVGLLMARWRYPSLTIHEVVGGCYHSESSWQTVIPRKVTGKFSIRLVGNQDPKKTFKLVSDYLDKLWKLRGSSNKFKVTLGGYGKPWTSSINHDNYRAAWKATRHVYNVDPDMIRIGETSALIVILQEITKKNIIMIPMGKSDDNACATDEKLDLKNYLSGTKLFAAYLYELSQ